MHDYLLFAGLYPHLSDDERAKVEVIAAWLFGDGYRGIIGRYGYFYAPGGSYAAKAVIFKLYLCDFTSDVNDLIFNLFVMSHFQAARASAWFSQALRYLCQYKNEQGRYEFPTALINEKKDGYVIFGAHMNVGEHKKSKLYKEILSTYWMERIKANMNY